MAAKKAKGGKDWDAIVQTTLARMRSGQSVRKIAKALDVDRGTLLSYLASDAHADHYARAREVQAHTLAEEVLAVADDPELLPDQKRIMVDARKWYASKLAPKSYGDKLTTEVTGSGGAPLTVRVVRE